MGLNYTAIPGDGVEATADLFNDRFEQLDVAIGDRDLLPTDDQASLVGAIVEIQDQIDGSLDDDGTLRSGAVDVSAVLVDGVVSTAKIAGGAVTGEKIANTAVETLKIADAAVTAAKIADGAVTAAKIANRTRSFLVPATQAYNVTGSAPVEPTTSHRRGLLLADGVATTVSGSFSVPADFVSGMTAQAVVISGGGGSLYSLSEVWYGAADEEWDTHSDALPDLSTLVGTDTRTLIDAHTLGAAAQGDVVVCQLTRWGNDGADTVGAAVYCAGFLVTYTADS